METESVTWDAIFTICLSVHMMVSALLFLGMFLSSARRRKFEEKPADANT